MPTTTEFAKMPVTRYPKELRLRVPGGMPDALERAADQHHQTPAEWARQALLRSLQAEGISLGDGKAAVGEQRETAVPGSLHRGGQQA
jgi:hypothetical protein